MTQTISPSLGPYAAFLFDMDGTLLSSLAVIERVWGRWFSRHGLDPDYWIPRIHGIRAADSIAALNLPGVDPVAEAARIEAEEIEDVEGIVEIAGAKAFLNSLPEDRWAVVTSAPVALARLRLRAADLPSPRVFVTAEDVSRGKPDPACYLLGAERLNVDPRQCLVFEDAAAGIEAGRSAGCDIIAITAMHRDEISTGHRKLRDYTGARITRDSGLLGLHVGD